MKFGVIVQRDELHKIFDYLKKAGIPFKNSPICFSMSRASSLSARGMMPGSMKDVRKSVDMTNRNIIAPTTGRTGLTFVARYGQLEKKNVH